MRAFLAILLCLWAGVIAAPFANPNFQVWRGESGYSTYHEWPSPTDVARHGLKDAWRHDQQSATDVYRDAVLAAFSDLKRWLVSPANAQTGRRAVLLSGVPGWVLRAGGTPATIDMNFATGQYYGCSLASCFSLVRASPKTNLLPSSPSGFAYVTVGSQVPMIDNNGWLIEEARINQLFNSTAPATQTTGTLANGTYTLWVNGSGSATMSAGTATGCGTLVASQGVPVNFTTSGAAGTCTVTVAGSLNAFQLEAGAFGTSFIVTAGATATRAADAVTLSGSLSTILNGANGFVFLRGNPSNDPTLTTTNHQIIGSSSNNSRNGTLNATTSRFNNNTSNIDSTFGVGTWATSAKVAMSWAPSRSVNVINNGTIGSAATTLAWGASITLGSWLAGQYINGYVQEIAAGRVTPPDATLKALTQ